MNLLPLVDLAQQFALNSLLHLCLIKHTFCQLLLCNLLVVLNQLLLFLPLISELLSRQQILGPNLACLMSTHLLNRSLVFEVLQHLGS